MARRLKTIARWVNENLQPYGYKASIEIEEYNYSVGRYFGGNVVGYHGSRDGTLFQCWELTDMENINDEPNPYRGRKLRRMDGGVWKLIKSHNSAEPYRYNGEVESFIRRLIGSIRSDNPDAKVADYNAEEFGAEDIPAHLTKWKMDYQFTARNGELFDIYNLGDECLKCGFYEYYKRNGIWYCSDCRAKKSGQRNAEEFGAETQLTNRQLGQLRRRGRERAESEKRSQARREEMERERQGENERFLRRLEGLSLSQKKRKAKVVWEMDAIKESRDWYIPKSERYENRDMVNARQELENAFENLQRSYSYGGGGLDYYYEPMLLNMEIMLNESFNSEEFGAEEFSLEDGQRIPNLTMGEWKGVSRALGKVGTFHNWEHGGTDGEGGGGTTLVVDKKNGVFGKRVVYRCDACGYMKHSSLFEEFDKHEPLSWCESCEDEYEEQFLYGAEEFGAETYNPHVVQMYVKATRWSPERRYRTGSFRTKEEALNYREILREKGVGRFGESLRVVKANRNDPNMETFGKNAQGEYFRDWQAEEFGAEDVIDMEKTLAASQALAEAATLVFMKHNIHNEEQQWQLVYMLADDMEAELCGVFGAETDYDDYIQRIFTFIDEKLGNEYFLSIEDEEEVARFKQAFNEEFNENAKAIEEANDWTWEEILGAEEFEATKGMDTYAQPFSELKIKPTKTKVGILLATVVAGGLWYSKKMKEE